MKRTFLPLLFIGILMFSVPAFAITYEFQPTPPDMLELNHAYYYMWSIDLTIPAGDVITSAELVVNDLWDGSADPLNIIYIHLVDTPTPLPYTIPGSSNLTYGRDQALGYIDNFATAGPLLTTYHDPFSDWHHRTTFTYTFTGSQLDTLATYADGSVGLAFDPDCHFGNTGVTFRVTTAVPEPAAILLLGAGCLAFPFFFRRKKN